MINYLKRFFTLVIAVTVAACGGGDDQTPDVEVPAQIAPSSVHPSKMTATDLDEFFLSREEARAIDFSTKKYLASYSAENGESIASVPDAPAGCAWMYIGIGIRCYEPSENLFVPEQGVDASSINAKNPFCNEVVLGKVFYGVTPVPGDRACYQFIVSSTTTVNFDVKLPVGISGIAELFHMRTFNNQGNPVARAKTPGPLTGTTTIKYQRMMLVIRTSNGTGGEVFSFGLNATPPQTMPNNDVLSAARDVHMNEEIRSTLPSSAGTAYYFFPHKVGQLESLFSAAFNPNEVQVAFRSAQRTGPSSFIFAGESAPLSAAQATGYPIVVVSSYPANTATSTSVTGTLVRVTGLNSATVKPAFQIRTGMKTINIDAYTLTNTEALSRYFPISGRLQAANNLIATVGVKDNLGDWVKNAYVELEIVRNEESPVTTQISKYRTNTEGKIASDMVLFDFWGQSYPVTTNFLASCSGAVISSADYGPSALPADHWKGTAQVGTFKVALREASAALPKYSTSSALKFTRMCSETYLGYR